MTRDEIIRMVREAGFDVVGDLYGEDALIAKLTRLVELEREACAKEVTANTHMFATPQAAESLANEIRARGEK